MKHLPLPILLSVASLAWPALSIAAIHTTVTYDYDAQGNRTLIQDGAGKQVTMTYTAQNRVDELRSPEGTTKHTWNGDGTLAHLQQPNGTEVQYDYFANKRVASIEHRVNGVATLSFVYTYDGNGNRKTEVRTDAASVLGPGQVMTTSYDYDANDRLEHMDDGLLETTYVIDPAGNRRSERVIDKATTATVSDKTFQVNAHDQVEGFTDSVSGMTVHYDYDRAGNRTGRTVTTGGATPTTTVVQYTFDARDRMTAVLPQAPNPDKDPTVTYAYDGDGRRIARSVGGAPATYFVYDGPRLLHEGSLSGSTLTLRNTYRRGARLDHLVVESGGGTPETRYYQLDALQTPVAQVSSIGTPISRMSYDAWGNMRPTLTTLLPRPPKTADVPPEPAEAFAALMAWSPLQ